MAGSMQIQENEVHLNKRARQPATLNRVFTGIIATLSVLVIVLIILMGITMNKAYENSMLLSNHKLNVLPIIDDIQNVFNSSVYAYSQKQDSKSCSDGKIGHGITGQTMMPGKCITVTPSKEIQVTRIPTNCMIYVHTKDNCTGKNSTVHDYNTDLTKPECVSEPGIHEFNDTYSGNGGFKSFQVLCR